MSNPSGRSERNRGSSSSIAVSKPPRRRPVEAIEGRIDDSAACEARVRKAVAKLVKTGAPFTVEAVYTLAGVGKTFIYDAEKRPELTAMVLAARDASKASQVIQAETAHEDHTASWRERALNAEALAASLRATVRERDARLADLTGQLYDPEGTHVVDENDRLRALVLDLNSNLRTSQQENSKLRRSLDGSRANVKRERERNVAELFPSPN